MKTRKSFPVLGVVLLLLALNSSLLASTKTQEFSGTIDQVWTACLRIADGRYRVDSSDRESRVIAFSNGVSFASWGMKARVYLQERGNGKIQVIISTKNRVLDSHRQGDREAKNYFKAVGEMLKMQQQAIPQMESQTKNEPHNLTVSECVDSLTKTPYFKGLTKDDQAQFLRDTCIESLSTH